MAQNQNNGNFLQPIFSTFGLIISLLSAVSPIFAQAQLGKYFLNSDLSLPASIVSVLLGIVLSWHLIARKGYIRIAIGIQKNRGNGYNEAWKYITGDNVITLIVTAMIILFGLFFGLNQLDGYIYAVIQATVYVLFFTFLIAIFSQLLARTKGDYEWEQQIANTGSIVYETLERNGTVTAGIQIRHNTQTQDASELEKAGIDPREHFMVRRLIVETVPQTSQVLRVYMSSDYKRMLAAIPISETAQHEMDAGVSSANQEMQKGK